VQQENADNQRQERKSVALDARSDRVAVCKLSKRRRRVAQHAYQSTGLRKSDQSRQGQHQESKKSFHTPIIIIHLNSARFSGSESAQVSGVDTWAGPVVGQA
jgi:hypothetical protein